MALSLEQIKDSLSELSTEERTELAHFLLLSLEPVDEGAEEAWREELKRRVDEIRSGQVQGKPMEEVLSRLRERYP
jgi:putative addiction module component (TIGR02574 family)